MIRVCKSCGVEENSFGAGYTQQMENEMAEFFSQYTRDGSIVRPQEICSHPKFKIVGVEPSIFINWNRADDKPIKGL
jgi:hypothetical protein